MVLLQLKLKEGLVKYLYAWILLMIEIFRLISMHLEFSFDNHIVAGDSNSSLWSAN